ncbi:uncharacterized protein B0H64DRAFT_379247 [Chaetomium fimeti]|uniref:Uncharacterized protein n=1 Tax=Chaetomium fimeti TaxID=1854472 RepID=A0AAE0HNP1_9PEZI|nr:hypothetical protein B0H64DRAFT_379247 [Chaetomium fimeti]
MELPNWLSIVLLLLSFTSFLPQLWLLWVRKDSSGLSLFYVLWNLIVATELFTLSFLLVVNYGDPGGPVDIFVHYPLSVGDRINLAQFTVVWVLWVVIFATCLAWRSNTDHGRRKAVSAIYVLFLLISVIPVFVDALREHSTDRNHTWVLALFGGLHVLFINPIVNFLGIAALFAQARILMGRTPGSGLGALSLVGLATQGATFALLAPLWLWRLWFSWNQIPNQGWLHWQVLGQWFRMVGFVAVDYAVFAGAQSVLLFIAVRRELHNSGASAGETAPLLGN